MTLKGSLIRKFCMTLRTQPTVAPHIFILSNRLSLHHSSISLSTLDNALMENSLASKIDFLIRVNILIFVRFSLRTAVGAGKVEKKS